MMPALSVVVKFDFEQHRVHVTCTCLPFTCLTFLLASCPVRVRVFWSTMVLYQAKKRSRTASVPYFMRIFLPVPWSR